ncbi:MAG: BamA/TamA family outer membrane protein [Myxococcales bacterium]|nr:BamA/TamA family outer membrane protein [Myxococcales bacterium]
MSYLAASSRRSRWIRRTICAGALALALGACAGKLRPGERWVDDVTLHGVKSVDKGKLEEGLAMHDDPWFGPPVLYRPGALDLDVQRILTFYASHGFFAARVIKREVKKKKDGKTVDIVLTVDEGKPTTLREVKITGLEQLPRDVAGKARASVKLAAGKRFEHANYLAAKKALANALRERGYAYAETSGKVQVDRDARWARIEIVAKPGPRVRFGKVTLSGNGPLPKDKLLRQVTIKPGTPYDERHMQATRANLNGLRVFSSVRLSLPEQPSDPAPVQLVVKPAKLREIRLGFGFGIERSRHEVRGRAEWTIHNWLGGLRRLRLRFKPAYVVLPAVWDIQRHGPTITTDVRLDQPDWLNTGLDAFTEIGYDIETQLGYRLHGPRASLGVAYGFFKRRFLGRAVAAPLLRVELSWNMRLNGFFDVDREAFDIGDTELRLDADQLYRLMYISPSLVFDFRDDPLDPRLGIYLSVRLEHGAIFYGGDFDYVKIVPEVRGYLPIFTKRLVLAVRAMFGHIEVYGRSNESPITQRFRLGGPVDHRGFTTGLLSPTSGAANTPTGGNAALLLSADLRWRIAKLAGNWLGLVGFVDAGDNVVTPSDIELRLMHIAVGGTLMYNTPIGTIRAGVGVRLNRLGNRLLLPASTRQNPDPGQRIAFMITIGTAY